MSAGREGSRQERGVAGALAGLLGESGRIPVAGPRDPRKAVEGRTEPGRCSVLIVRE